jgi:hypothetical protein
MSSLTTSLQQLNEHSFVSATDLELARQRWNARHQEMRLQQPLDALFIIIYAHIQTQIEQFVRSIFDKISTASSVSDLEVPIWSFHALSAADEHETGKNWSVVTRDEQGLNLHAHVPVLTLLRSTDVCLRLSAIFGSDFSVFYRPVLTHDTKYELVLRFLPDGRSELDKIALSKVWSKYGRDGIIDKLHHLPPDQIFVLDRGSVLGELTVRAPTKKEKEKEKSKKRSINSDENDSIDSSYEDMRHPHYGCYCEYSF